MSHCSMLNCLVMLQRSALTSIWFWHSNTFLGARGHSAFVHHYRLKDFDSFEQKG